MAVEIDVEIDVLTPRCGSGFIPVLLVQIFYVRCIRNRTQRLQVKVSIKIPNDFRTLVRGAARGSA